MPDKVEAPERPVVKVNPPSDSGGEQKRRENKELCQVCQSLDLSVHCFKVQSGSSNSLGNSSSDRPLHSSTAARRLGSLHGIKARSARCALCALIIDSVEEAGSLNAAAQSLDEGAENQLQRATCSISWEIDGRESASARGPNRNPKNQVRGVTRRMHIRWNHPRLSDAYLVYVAPEKFSRTTSDANRVWGKDSLFLGRTITENIENQALIQSWLELCSKTHRGPCCYVQHRRIQRFIEMISHSYFGVIDVHNMQLTQLPCKSLPGLPYRRTLEEVKPEPYIALSYVWGKDIAAHTTLTENVMLHRTHGGLEEVLQKLPQAIKDSIDLVRRLGFRYIWIDRLCIVQNSPRSWKLNAYNMDLIYGNAELTICAADGDASEGLRAIRPSTRNTNQFKRYINPKLQLMVTRPPEMYIRASEWNERAWTFQERLLSRRCLIFTNGRVYFQCRSTGMSEDIFGDQKGAGWSLDLVNAPMQMFRQLHNRSIWVYMKCVELYTERKLTQVKDIQAAFSGMANMMEERMRAPFIHGLPSSHFDLALLWEPIKSAKRRFIEETSTNASIPDFPSWSWTGWVGEVKYKEDLMSGILDNVSDWLDTRTWIQWWVRDGHGDLRPLWDSCMSEEDQSEDCKWRGYTDKRAIRDERPRRISSDSESYVACEPIETAIRPRRRDRSPPNSIRRSVLNSDEESDGYSGDDAAPRRYRDDEEEICYVRQRRKPSPGPEVTTRTTKQTRFTERPGPYRYSPANDLPRDRERSDLVPHGRSISFDPSPFAGRGSPDYSPGGKGGFPRTRERFSRDSGHYTRPRQSNRYDDEPISHRRTRSGYRPYTDPVLRAEERTTRSEHPTHNAEFFDMFFEDDEEEFNITLRDYPYRVVKAAFDPKPETSEYPLLPILQFRTWHTWLYIKESVPPEQQYEDRKRMSMNLGLGQVRHHIADQGGDWCGSIVLDAEWATKAANRQEFIAISEAKGFTAAECQEWTYYIPKERDQSEWDLFNVLLIERKDERWERVGVGKVFKEAFRSANQREIMLS